MAASPKAKSKHKPSACRCTNHMGGPKMRHRSREAALLWALRQPARAGFAGMRLEPYQCPTSSCWHIRTARAAR